MVKFKRIKNLRIDNDLTQIELAKLLNVKSDTYSKWERGINNIPIEYIIKLSKIYNVSIDYILEISNNKKYCLKNDIDIQQILTNLKKLRIESKLSQEEFSKKIGISQRTYSNVERGTRRINSIDIYMIASCNNISIDDLLNQKTY